MHSIEIAEANAFLSFPESALELSQKQLLQFSNAYLHYTQGRINFSEFKTTLVYKWLNMVRTANLSDQANEQIAENVLQLTKLVNPFFEDQKQKGKTVKVLRMQFYRQLLPVVKVNGIEFYGPADALFNTTWGEYLQTLNYFTDFVNTADEALLDMMIATLYRPKSKETKSNERVAFNSVHTPHYAKHLGKLDAHVKNAIFLYVASAQHFLANATALDIGGGVTIDISVLYQKNSSTSTAPGLGMLGTTFSIAESKVFGNITKVAKQSTIDIFAYLVDQHNKMKELQSQNQKA